MLIESTNPLNPANHDWSPIETVPRDGTEVIVYDPDSGAFLMRWVPGATNPILRDSGDGLWVAVGGGMTWSEAGGFGPTKWSTPEAFAAFQKRASN